MSQKLDTPEAAKKKQQAAALRMTWRVIIVVLIAFTLAKYFRVPLPF